MVRERLGKLDELLPLEDGLREIGRDEVLPPSTRWSRWKAVVKGRV